MAARLVLDRFGRVLIPKAIRDASRLQAGEPLELEVDGGALHLRPAARTVHPVEHHGRLVFGAGGRPITSDPVEDVREARLNGVLGRW